MSPRADKQTALEIRRRVSEHLSQNNIFEDLKRIVSEVVGGNEDATLAAINQKEVISQIVREQGGATPVLPAAASDDSFLHVTMLGGRAFIDSIVHSAAAAGDEASGPVRLCLHFGEQRFASRPVAFCAEPSFDDTFLLRLPLPSDAPAAAVGASPGSQRAQALLRLKQPLHLLVLQRRGQSDVLLSSLLLEWRKVLQAGRCVLSAELPGVGPQAKLPAGSLELRLELLPAVNAEDRVGEAALLAQLKREREIEVSAERRFFAAAKEWWETYLEARPAHRKRVVKLFAMSEFGVQRPVCCFVRPLCARRLLDSPAHAAHFVSLINFERHAGAYGGDETWHTVHATLCRPACWTWPSWEGCSSPPRPPQRVIPAYALLSTLQRSHQANGRALRGSGAPSEAGRSRRFGRVQHPQAGGAATSRSTPAWSKCRLRRGRARQARLLTWLSLAPACSALSGGATEPLGLPGEAEGPSSGRLKVAHFAAFDHPGTRRCCARFSSALASTPTSAPARTRAGRTRGCSRAPRAATWCCGRASREYARRCPPPAGRPPPRCRTARSRLC